MEAGGDRRVALQARGRVGPGGLDLEVEGVKLEALGRTFTQEGQARLHLEYEGWSPGRGSHWPRESRLSTSGHLGLEGPFRLGPSGGNPHGQALPPGALPHPLHGGDGGRGFWTPISPGRVR